MNSNFPPPPSDYPERRPVLARALAYTSGFLGLLAWPCSYGAWYFDGLQNDATRPDASRLGYGMESAVLGAGAIGMTSLALVIGVTVLAGINWPGKVPAFTGFVLAVLLCDAHIAWFLYAPHIAPTPTN